MSLVEVLIRAQSHDGDEPWEATASLPMVPLKGMSLEVWVQHDMVIPESAFDTELPEDGGPSEHDRVFSAYFSSQPIWLEVKDVILSTYDAGRIEVWVSSDGIDSDQMKRLIYAINRREMP